MLRAPLYSHGATNPLTAIQTLMDQALSGRPHENISCLGPDLDPTFIARLSLTGCRCEAAPGSRFRTPIACCLVGRKGFILGRLSASAALTYCRRRANGAPDNEQGFGSLLEFCRRCGQSL